MTEGQGQSATRLARWRDRARALKREVFALALAGRDPRVPWYARLLALGVVAYAFSPIDLIPDPIPILGYLDDLILIPLGIALVIRLISPQVLAEHRAEAQRRLATGRPRSLVGAAIIIAIWLALAAAIGTVAYRALR